MLTDEELAKISARHTSCEEMGCCYCYLESDEWPCETRRLLDEIDRLKNEATTHTTITVTSGQYGRMKPDGSWDVQTYGGRPV